MADFADFDDLLTVRNGPLQDAMRLSRLTRQARAAALLNPRNAGLYTGALTITDRAATAPAETPQPFNFGGFAALGVWRTTGGTPVLVNGAWRFSSAVIAATGGSVGTNNGATANWWRVAVMMDARYLTLRLFPQPNAYRLIVDGRYVSLAGTLLGTQSGTTLQHLLLDFGARGVRQVILEGHLAAGFAGGFTEATGSLWPIETADAPNGAFLGDSYIVGSAATLNGDGIAPHLGDWMGQRMLASGSGGTGWGTPTNYRFDERIARGDLALNGTDPDIGYLMASINDRNRDLAVVQANAAAGVRAVRQRYPTIPIIVFGSLGGATGPGTTPGNSIIANEQAVQAAVASVADPMTAFVPVSTDSAGAWVSGTGKIGTTTGTGNSDWATVADGIHPSDEGCAYIGRRYAAAAVAALNTMAQARMAAARAAA